MIPVNPPLGHRLPVFALSLLVAAALTLSPLPAFAIPWRPAWLLLTVIYWTIALPQSFAVVSAFAVGLFRDVLVGDLLGQNALAFVLVAWLAARYHRVIRNLSMVQQAVSVLLLVLLSGVVTSIVQRLAQLPPGFRETVTVALASALVWPWVFLVLRSVRRRWLPTRTH